ncbi:hypothetical protein A1O1_06468 [Capronia coronata CBS 617.96]|uniref:Hydrophobin n=1 Tax=Capronia coronata CBS 617.96 TaxID=1182541 RepID=W9YUZ2_9EURO|nr:uncharacterized protein A1O1_06468 [Capronia coronata CBS 617.96]EXJ86099.1 hypothetical protein A1O1_06468 [Capronia coronata CBS 617.96]
MRFFASHLLVGLSFSYTGSALPDNLSAYSNPLSALSVDALLVKRQSCASGLNSCSALGSDSVCCPSGTNCALDEAGHIACCPSNAVCTGTIAGTLTGSSTGSATGTTSTTSDSVLGGSSSSSTASPPGVTSLTTGVSGGGSTVPNNFYPFIYIPTSYANADLCTSAYSSCQSASTSCFASLAGANGVTVSGLGGGITVQGASGTLSSSASSICSSLSAAGCYNLQQSQCSMFGTASGATATSTATETTGFVQVGNVGPRQTPCPGMLYAAGAGVMFGAVGALV